MKVSTLFLLPLLVLGVACERHSADSAAKHDDHKAPAAAAAPAAAKPAEKEGVKKEQAPGGAPKFFENGAPNAPK
jgi:hypothetical protein